MCKVYHGHIDSLPEAIFCLVIITRAVFARVRYALLLVGYSSHTCWWLVVCVYYIYIQLAGRVNSPASLLHSSLAV